MLNRKHLLKAAAMACLLLSTGPLLAAGMNPGNSAADTKILADIPATAQAVVIIHDMAALDKKVAMLAEKLKIPVLPPSLRHIEKTLDLPRGITAHGTAAVVVIPNSAKGGPAHAVMILPAKDPAAAIANMNFSTGTDGIEHGQSANGEHIYAMAGKHCIMVSQHHGALLQCKTVGTAITPMLTESEQPLAEKSDVYVLVNIPRIRKPLEKALHRAGPIAADPADAAGKAAHASELKSIGRKVAMRLADDTHSALIGLRITSGALTISMVSDEKAGSQVAKTLECLRPLAEKPLAGLPDSSQFFEAVASNIDGTMITILLNQWAGALPKTATSGARDNLQLAKVIRQFAALLTPLSECNTLVIDSSKTKGPIMSSVALAKSTTPAASAALMVHLLAGEGRWLSHLQFSMGSNLKYHMTVAPETISIDSVPFTAITQSMVLPAPGTPQSDSIRSAMKMEQKMLGINTQTYLIGSHNKRLIVGGNCSHKFLTETVNAAAADSDTLDSNPAIVAAKSHILPHASVVMYADPSPVIAAITQRLEAMANMNSPMLKLPTTEPMSISLAAHHNTLTGQWRMPMKNLQQLSTRIHALLPLAMMMEMQSMQAGQGAGPPQ